MKKALTIGELLITMAIIGTIATLVLPGFIKDYHKKIYTTKLKKVVEMIDSAVSQACTDSGVSYFYQTQYADSTDTTKQKEFIEQYFKIASTDDVTQSYDAIAGGDTTSFTFSDKLASGEFIYAECPEDSDTTDFYVDINGSEGPNVGGRDMFVITLNNKTNILSGAFPENCGGAIRGAAETEDDYVARMRESTDYKANGQGCFEHITQDNWEMKY